MRAFVARVETAGGHAFVELELFGEFAAGDAEVSAEEVVDGKAGVAVEFFGYGLTLSVGKFAALKEGGHVVAQRVFLHFFEEGLEGWGLGGKLVVIPGRRGEGRKGEGVGLIHAGIGGGAVDAVVEGEDLREQDDSIEVDAAEIGGEDGRARSTVAFAEDVLRRVPAIVPGEEAADEALEGVAVAVDSVEGFGLVLAEGAAEAGAGGVDEDDVGYVEERVFVVDDAVGRAFLMLGVRSDDALGAEGSHVQPHGG